jgi:hypothetical protein
MSPAIIAVAAEARSFYVEFRARDEVGGFGHSYVTLGAINAVGEVRETVAASRIAGVQFPLNSTSFCTLPARPTASNPRGPLVHDSRWHGYRLLSCRSSRR